MKPAPPHYHRNNRYNDESTIIFTEQYNIYTDPYSGQYQESYPPENVYSSPGTAGSHNSGSSAVQDEAGDDIRSADDIITEILENEALSQTWISPELAGVSAAIL